jgi:hypothetical protein
MSESKLDLNERGIFELLSRAAAGEEITVRDDRCELGALSDVAALDRRRGGRLRLVDTGRFVSAELEWLAQAGADIYTSDESGRSPAELSLLVKSAARGGAFVAYFLYGPVSGTLTEAARTGVYLHMSDREQPRDVAALAGLAYACRRAGAWLVYYHYGSVAAEFEAVAENGGWVHLPSESLPRGEGLAPFLDAARDASAAGSGIVLHLADGLDATQIEDLMKAGAFVIFRDLHDFRSPLRNLERRAARRRLDIRAYYLTPDFLP